MDSLLRILPAFLLMIRIILAKDLEVLRNYVIKQTESCPDVGYFFRRESVPNMVGPEPCYLCFCQGNSTAVCWLRENSRCDVEKFHHHRVGRYTRARRSPVGLSDIFFRDATRDFFDKQLPEQCKPYESSFSDGCPPADWCVGCTVCDCDANGRWDCHILSFCNGDESKKLRNRKVPLPKMPTRRVYHQSQPPPKNKVTLRPKKIVKKSIPKPQLFRNKKPKNNTKKPNKNARKSNNNGKRRNENSRKSMINRRNQLKGRLRPKPKKNNTTRKPQRRKNVAKKPQKKTTKNKPPTTTRALQKKQIRKKPNTATKKPQMLDSKESEIIKLMNAKNEYDQSKLGRRIIRKVMSTVQKMIAKQVAGLQNATRVQRSINNRIKKDCQKKKKEKKKGKKRAKLSYKELREKKLKKYKKQYNFRKKRDALDLMDLSVIELKESSNTEKLMKDNLKDVDLSVKRITKNVTVLDARDSSMIKTELSDYSTKSNSLAYEAAEISTITNKPLVLKSAIAKILYYKYSIDKNASNSSFTTEIVPIKDKTNETSLGLDLIVTNKTKNITENKKKYAVIMSNPELNNLKYQKWERLKQFRDTNNNIQINEVLKLDNPEKEVNGTKLEDSLIKPFKYKVHGKDIQRKLEDNNKYKLKKIITSNFKTASTNYIKSQFTTNDTQINYNISSLHNLLQNLMREVKKPIKQSKQKTTFGMFKYLRNMFKKLFSRRKGVHLEHKTNEGHTLEILCENIEACFMNKNNRIALRAKIHDLNKETEKIFRTIKMIKGLLYLIEMPYNKVDNTTKKSFNEDIRKLDAILKGTYATDHKNYLSETQEAQIGYVKENINQFIESVGRFATILNEILEVLYKNNKKYSCQRNLRLGKKKKKLSSLNKIKNLLIRYNVVQNTFMKKMYRLLTDVEKNMTTENLKVKVSDIEMNNPKVVDRYSKNIIENLRRLKNLALALNYSRRKRQTMREDDAIEYLLVLMEYLLKQNHPLDTAPVNDGIDLLIEAIQNAPDIKQIQKKIIDSLPTTLSATRTTSIDLSYLKEDSISNSNRISKEESKENNSFKHENELAIEHVVVDDVRETTQIVYYKRFEDGDNITVYSEYDTTTEFTVKTKNDNTEKGETGEKTGFDKFESAIDETRKYEVYASDIEDEAIIPAVTMSTTEKEVPLTVTTKVEDSTIVPLQDYKLDDDSVDDKKTKLEWIEENFGKEIREYRVDNLFNISDTTVSLTTQATTIKPKDQSIDNISSITVELEDEDKKKKSKAVADEVLYRKQIEFLNSLDYGTERSEFDDHESKDDEKYSGDGFSSYFVK